MLPEFDWLSWAGSFNQASMLPFLAFLWTLSRIPDVPKKALHGWYLYLVFIAVAIPAGIYSKTHLGTSMANVDWLHGVCETLLSAANLLIVLGLRDAVSAATVNKRTASSTAAASTGSASVAGSAADCPSATETHSDAGQDALADMQYIQQLHEMYSSQHSTREAAAAAVGAPVKAEAVSHVWGLEAAAAHKATSMAVGDSVTAAPMSQEAASCRPVDDATGSTCSRSGDAAAWKSQADASHAQRDALSDMQCMQQLRNLHSTKHNAESTDPTVAAAGGASHVAASTARHLQGFGASARDVDDIGMADGVADDHDTAASSSKRSGHTVRCAPHLSSSLSKHNRPRRLCGVAQHYSVMYRAGCSKTPARALHAGMMQ